MFELAGLRTNGVVYPAALTRPRPKRLTLSTYRTYAGTCEKRTT